LIFALLLLSSTPFVTNLTEAFPDIIIYKENGNIELRFGEVLLDTFPPLTVTDLYIDPVPLETYAALIDVMVSPLESGLNNLTNERQTINDGINRIRNLLEYVSEADASSLATDDLHEEIGRHEQRLEEIRIESGYFRNRIDNLREFERYVRLAFEVFRDEPLSLMFVLIVVRFLIANKIKTLEDLSDWMTVELRASFNYLKRKMKEAIEFFLKRKITWAAFAMVCGLIWKGFSKRVAKLKVGARYYAHDLPNRVFLNIVEYALAKKDLDEWSGLKIRAIDLEDQINRQRIDLIRAKIRDKQYSPQATFFGYVNPNLLNKTEQQVTGEPTQEIEQINTMSQIGETDAASIFNFDMQNSRTLFLNNRRYDELNSALRARRFTISEPIGDLRRRQSNVRRASRNLNSSSSPPRRMGPNAIKKTEKRYTRKLATLFLKLFRKR
jgi:hypothetical protein